MDGSAQSSFDVLVVLFGSLSAAASIVLFWRNSPRLQSCFFNTLLLLLIALSGSLGILNAIDRTPSPPLGWAFVLGAARTLSLLGLAVVGSVALFLALIPSLRGVALSLLLRYLRWPESRDFAAAENATTREGTVIRDAGLTVWTDIDPSRHAIFASTLTSTKDVTASVTGLDLARIPDLRLLAFNDASGFETYGGDMGQIHKRAGGYYMRNPRPVIVVHREAVEKIRPNLDFVLAHEMVHYLTHGAMGPIRELWLSEGLAMYLPALALDTHPRSVKPTRILQASIKRGDMPSARTFLKATYLRLATLSAKTAKGGSRAEAAGQIVLFYFLSGSFVRYLHRRDAAAFQRFLRGYRRSGMSRRHFKSCFGVTPKQALQDLITYIMDLDPPQIVAPQIEDRAGLEAEMIAPLRDPDTPLDMRLELIGSYGIMSTAWRVDVIIDQLEAAERGRFETTGGTRSIRAEDSALIRAEAQRALENVAGDLVADRSEGWRAWAASLPTEAVGPERT